jgi:wyosine [tRNA(Phe)-imidazoG37] synthetase (radical SAM superfamily)
MEEKQDPMDSRLQASSVYGPVRSWRVGSSLGIDLLLIDSICSFNCSYCQLGNIQVRTRTRSLFVPTEKVMADLEKSAWREASVVTFSGSGEPTLALNLGETTRLIREFTGLPTLVLTNGTLLNLPEVREELGWSDRVFVKLDAASEETFQRVNRPVEGITLASILKGLKRFRDEYSGYLGLQMMFVHSSRDRIEDLAALIREIRPDEVQVNTPTRPYPTEWHLATRGSHEGVSYPARPVKPVSAEYLLEIGEELSRLCPGVSIQDVANVREQLTRRGR